MYRPPGHYHRTKSPLKDAGYTGIFAPGRTIHLGDGSYLGPGSGTDGYATPLALKALGHLGHGRHAMGDSYSDLDLTGLLQHAKDGVRISSRAYNGASGRAKVLWGQAATLYRQLAKHVQEAMAGFGFQDLGPIQDELRQADRAATKARAAAAGTDGGGPSPTVDSSYVVPQAPGGGGGGQAGLYVAIGGAVLIGIILLKGKKKRRKF